MNSGSDPVEINQHTGVDGSVDTRDYSHQLPSPNAQQHPQLEVVLDKIDS